MIDLKTVVVLSFLLRMRFLPLQHLLMLSTTYTRVLLSASWAYSCFSVQVGTCLGERWLSGTVFFSEELPVKLLSHFYCIIVAAFPLLPLCLPACLSQWPCRICMVIGVITGSSLCLRLISPRCFIPGVETSGWKPARSQTSHSSWQRLCNAVFPLFFILCLFLCIPYSQN